MEHHWPWVNTTSPIVLEAIVVETQKQPTRIGVIQSLDAGIRTTRMEMVVTFNMDVVRGEY